MRFMILVKADKNSESGVLPDEKLLTEMGKYNDELVKAGVLLAAEGLHRARRGRVLSLKEEAIEWVKRVPNPMPGTESEIEIRQVFEAEDRGTNVPDNCYRHGCSDRRCSRLCRD